MDRHSRSRGRQAQALRGIKKIADSRVNDAVKLAFLDGGLDRERMEEIDRLELGALTEFKRSANGGVEIKLVDRVAALEKLAALGGEDAMERAERFFQALEQKAGDGQKNGA